MIRGIILSLLLCLSIGFGSFSVYAQENDNTAPESQELSEVEGIPVIVKHLPEWENKKNEAVFSTEKEKIIDVLGNRPILEAVEFVAGTEAVTANYPQGKLLIVEYTTPQVSVETDKKVTEKLPQINEIIFYRRIGNYNVFLFDGKDEAAANQLFEQIKYQKVVQWLGTDPNLYKQAERMIVGTLSGVFVSTVLAIVLGLGFSVVLGFFAGLLYYRYMEKKRGTYEVYSDAGGMTRLNLDHLTPDIVVDKLLKK